jgi:hypothetical protein
MVKVRVESVDFHSTDFHDIVREAVVDSIRQAAEAAGQDPDLDTVRRAVEADMAGAAEPRASAH